MNVESLIFKSIRWKHNPLKNGDLPIWLYVCHEYDVTYLSTGFGTSSDYWDEEKDQLRSEHPEFPHIIAKVQSLIEDLKFEVRLADRNHEDDVSLATIKSRLKNKGKKDSKDRESHYVVPSFKRMKILEFCDNVINEEEEAGNPGGADIFNNCGKSPVFRFLRGSDIYFSEFDERKCKDFEKFLKGLDLKETSTSLYLRTFYRIWNIAGEKGHHSNDDKLHPSNFIKFRAYKKIKTSKRAIPVIVFKSLAKLSFPYESRKFRSLQYILFSYYARGINFNDICKLKRNEIIGNQINYKRSKTGKQFCFELHPKALKIVSLFRMYPMQSDNDYVFPILMNAHDNPRRIDQRVESALKDVNEDLKDFAKAVKYPGNLTSYVFRHSFATHLELANVDIKYITEALGHETEEQTRIYLSEISDWRTSNAVKKAIR